MTVHNPAQTLMVDALGRIIGEQKDTNPVDVSQFGDMDVERFSEVLFDKGQQMWFVIFRSGAPAYLRNTLLKRTLASQAVPEQRIWTNSIPVGYTKPTVFFKTYGDAVAVERRVLAHLMKEGKFDE